MIDTQSRLIAALGKPFVETHISYVVFDGPVAYKIKKAVRFPFLDFSTLALREFFCREELRLNRRFAPSIYLDVVRVTGTLDTPRFGGSGPVLEYAVKMRAFDQEGLLSRVIARDELTSARVDELATVVATFHQRTARAAGDSPYASPETILADARANFTELTSAELDPHVRARLAPLEEWTVREGSRCARAFGERKQAGFVRECHGDLHLGNLALVDGVITLFDCIEFNPSMRWIDVMSDVAFLAMDLHERHRPDLAGRFLNQYLQQTGDYDGLAVLRFYVAYRALVRAKIAALGGRRAAVDGYLDLAERQTAPAPARIVITHGLSGSGKSTRAQTLVDAGAIAIRSDVERKRLGGLTPQARSHSAVGEGLYSADIDRTTYERLATLARGIVGAGYTAVVDAAFLKHWQRDLLKAAAISLNVPFSIADCNAPEPVLRDRIARRLVGGVDASEATLEVLAHQLSTQEPLDAEERSVVLGP